jgi:phosphonate transport system substrate-binding protein
MVKQQTGSLYGMSSTLVMGAVAYDPKVVTIWEGFKQYFIEHGLEFDYVLYSNYERLVRSLFEGHVQVAWNSPLAWLQARQVADQLGREVKAVAMRDTDVNLRTVIAVRTDSDIRSLADLRGKVVAVGASDSPQATLIPLWHLQQAGLRADVDFEVQRHELLVGLHGDHVGGERDAAKSLVAGRADAACMIGSNFAAFFADGTLPPGSLRVLAETESFDHCNFTVVDGTPEPTITRFVELLSAMSYDDPQVRPLLDMEGLKCWLSGRTSGYDVLAAAVDGFGTVEAFVASCVPGSAARLSD